MDTIKTGANVGLSNIIVIIVVSLATIGLVSSYIISGQVVTTKENIKTQQDELKKLKNKKEDANARIIHLSPYITEQANPETARKFLEEKLRAYGIAAIVDRLETINGEDVTLEVLIGLLTRRVTNTEIGKQLADYGKNNAKQRLDKLNEIIDLIQTTKSRQLAAIQPITNELEAKETNETRFYTTRKNELDQKIKQLKQQDEDKGRQLTSQINDIKLKIERTKHEIEFLNTRTAVNRNIIEPQGKVINPSINDWYAFINVGANDNIKPGLKFRVYRRDKNGTIRWKGMVEVKKIFSTYSQVAITQVFNQLDPIVEDDYINNIFYNYGKPKHIALMGEILSSDFWYNKAELERRLTELGVKVESTISLKTDFVILGKNAEILDPTGYRNLRLLNIPYMEGKEIRDFIQYCLGD